MINFGAAAQYKSCTEYVAAGWFPIIGVSPRCAHVAWSG